ncbi:MAG TPA: hypothetical protein PLI53_05340 [Geobacteraceae bacterium]|nr:hypothetical protein [Geobacteraceae bacterium]
MEQYEVQPYKRSGWVIVQIDSGREVILFNDKGKAEEACRFLNESEN